jgi:hypothetical protein
MSMPVAHSVWLRVPALAQLAASPVAWSVLATAYLVLSTLGPGLATLADRLGDSDDAVRLVMVRELMAGASWFDTTVPRIGAPEPLVSHWSRLIDLGLASLMTLLRPLLGMEGAELATRVLWPALLFFPLQLVVVREAHRRAGPWAGLFAVALTVTCASALVQFRAGRIDHHNAQVLCAVAGVLFLVRSLDERRCGVIGGLLFGIGLSIGLEALPLIVPALAFAALAVVWQPRPGAGVVDATVTATGTLLLVFVLTVPPARWLDMHCDALSLNLPILAAFCAAGLWAARRLGEHAGLAMRGYVAGGAALIGAAIYAQLEPACLGGPMGQLNPALNAIWLDDVVEGRSVLWLTAHHPAAGLSFLAFVLAGAAAQIAIWRRQPDVGTGLLTAVVLVAVLLGCWQIRLMSYASWLAILPLAVWCASLRDRPAFSSPAAAIAVVALLSQSALGLVAGAAVAGVRQIAGLPAAVQGADIEPCYRSVNLRPLAALAPGLVVAEIDIGPFVVATTAHRVVAAPYHRLDKGILANHAILEGPSEQAQQRMRSLGVDYVVLCAVPGQRTAPGSLRGRLLANESVPFLQELEAHPARTVRVWRVAADRPMPSWQ